MELTCLYRNVGDFLSSFCPFIAQPDLCAHIVTYLQNSGAGRINAYICDTDLGVRNDQSCRDKVCSGGNVSRYRDLLPVQFPAGLNNGRSSGAVQLMDRADIRAEFFQHQLCVVPGKTGFCYRGLPFGIKPGKKNTGFYLRACDRRIIVYAVKPGGGNVQRSTSVVQDAGDIRAHLSKGIDDTLHGTGI